MRVLFITRSSLYENRGGDTIQILNTAKQLQVLGVEADIKLTNESIDYRNYDLIHFFNIIRPADILIHAKRSGKPYVVSTIFVDYSEFDRKHRKGFPGLVFKLFSGDTIEYLKTLARMVIRKERVVSREYLWKGHRNSVRYIIRNAAVLLPNSESEYRRLKISYGEEQDFRVIPNAVDITIFKQPGDLQKDRNMVLCVGRIEGLKNQLNLIKALNNSEFRLYIIGKASTNQAGYYELCKKEASGNIFFIDGIAQQQLVDFYSKAKVHILPSWFETTGLSSLEAGIMECEVVVTEKGDTREYFSNMAFYCDPGSISSIREAVELASKGDKGKLLSDYIRNNFTWDITAQKTLEAYRFALTKSS